MNLKLIDVCKMSLTKTRPNRNGCPRLAVSPSVGCDGKTCEEGGGVVVDGVCEGKCDPTKCLADNTCVGNRCVLLCTSQQDCVTGQECATTKSDANQDVTVCVYTQKAENIGLPCPVGNECDPFSACPDGSPCGPDVKSSSALP